MNKNTNIVFSTNPQTLNKKEIVEAPLNSAKQDLRIWLENKPGGKKATIVRGFNGPNSNLRQLGKELKSLCHVGGTVKNGEIMMQGNVRKQVYDFLIENGYRAKLSGG